MLSKVFNDLPGVGEIIIHQIEIDKTNERNDDFWLGRRKKNLWLDDLAFKQLAYQLSNEKKVCFSFRV